CRREYRDGLVAALLPSVDAGLSVDVGRAGCQSTPGRRRTRESARDGIGIFRAEVGYDCAASERSNRSAYPPRLSVIVDIAAQRPSATSPPNVAKNFRRSMWLAYAAADRGGGSRAEPCSWKQPQHMAGD